MDISTDLLRWVEIDLDALTHNVRAICQHLRPGTKFGIANSWLAIPQSARY